MSTFQFKPDLTVLEGREVPATHTFVGGNLTVYVQNSDYDPNFYRQGNFVALSVDYRTYGGGANAQVEGRMRIVTPQGSRSIPVMARDVKSITVVGTANKDIIDLSAVAKLSTPATTPRNLDGKITILGADGNDRLTGSPSFHCVYVGGNGTDRVTNRKAGDTFQSVEQFGI